MDLNTIKNNFDFYKDFPKQGINFIDVGSILKKGDVFKEFIDIFSNKINEKFEFDKIVALESRGFLFASPVSYVLEKPMIMIRKKGKLPGEILSISSEKEYGADILEIQKNSINPGERVLIIDDILATGGTAKASMDLIKQMHAKIAGLAFVGEIPAIANYELFKNYDVLSMFEF